MALGTPSIHKGRPSVLSANQVGTVETIAGLTLDEHGGDSIQRCTAFHLSGMAMSITDSLAYGSQKLYTMPAGAILVNGCVASLAFTTTSAIASTLNSGVTVQWGIGSAAASATTLATTMIDFLTGSGGSVPTFTSSTTINVASATVNSQRTVAQVYKDGTGTSVPVYLNLAVGTGTDIDGDATLSVTGEILLFWQLHGDY